MGLIGSTCTPIPGAGDPARGARHGEVLEHAEVQLRQIVVGHQGVAAQVEIETKVSKRFITFQFQALKAGAFIEAARGKITE